MTSQTKMNAGAEYVLYRIWATLQDSQGIHAESLFTCLGALSGYACQAYVRQAGTRAGAGAGLNLPLAESPLSVWALVGRAVQKAGKPLPDIGEIFAHVTQTTGTNAFGVPRTPDGHRPRHAATFYLEQIWPQILPIARRFCRKPALLPVLFGIAIQRAIEHTEKLLNPTLSASIAMECAVAMSRVALPEPLMDVIQPIPAAPEIVLLSPKPPLTLPTGIRADAAPARTSRSAKKKRTRGVEANALAANAFSARVPATKVFATIASLAIIAIGSAMWKTQSRDTPTVTPRVERKLRAFAFQPTHTRPAEQPVEESAVTEEAPPPIQSAVAAADPDVPAAPPEQPANEGIITDDP